MTAKIIILFVISIIMGGAFCATGIIFRSQKFLDRLNDAAPIKSPENFKKNQIRAKGSSTVAFVIGAITILWGFILLFFPQLKGILTIIYMVCLVIAFIFLTIVFK